MKNNLKLRENMYKPKKRYYFIAMMLLLIGAPPLWAQVDEASRNVRFRLGVVSLLDIEPDNTAIALSFTAPIEAGNPIISTTDNTKWLNYTSAVIGSQTRNISVAVDQTIDGIDLQLLASSGTGGDGALGNPGSSITLVPTSQTLISSIGGAYTGNGVGRGHQLTYSLDIDDYTTIVSNTQNITVIFTISN